MLIREGLATALVLSALKAGAALPGEPIWERHSFALPESVWSVAALDANADGRLDLVAMGETRVFALLAPEWRETLLLDSREPKMLYCVALDADRDGDLDLAVGRYRVPWIEYREARAAGRESPEPIGPDFSIAWLENVNQTGHPWPLHIIDREFNGIHGLATGDVDGDGAVDLIADSIMGPAFPRSLGWFPTPPTGSSQFARLIVSHAGADGRPHYLEFADLDADGHGDIVLGDSGGGTFTWWRQEPGNVPTWKRHLIGREPGATNVRIADVNGDGRLDVVGSCGHGSGIFWFRAPDWQRHEIDPGLRDPHALAAGDFDGDGDVDVAAASYTAHRVRWYLNSGDGAFALRDIDSDHGQEAYDLKTTDLDGDGRLDLILAGRETRNAVWFRNLRPD